MPLGGVDMYLGLSSFLDLSNMAHVYPLKIA